MHVTRDACATAHCLVGGTCRTRKAVAEAEAELYAKEASLSSTSSKLAAQQSELAAVEVALGIKRKELQGLQAQLQAAATQECQDARKQLLEDGEILYSQMSVCVVHLHAAYGPVTALVYHLGHPTCSLMKWTSPCCVSGCTRILVLSPTGSHSAEV